MTGKARVVVKTGFSRHGVAMSDVCVFMDMHHGILMSKTDVERRHTSVERMGMPDATICPATIVIRFPYGRCLSVKMKVAIKSVKVVI